MEVQDPAAEARRHPARPGHGFEEPGGAAHGRAAAEMRGGVDERLDICQKEARERHLRDQR